VGGEDAAGAFAGVPALESVEEGEPFVVLHEGGVVEFDVKLPVAGVPGLFLEGSLPFVDDLRRTTSKGIV
jgi:hypothetical protein